MKMMLKIVIKLVCMSPLLASAPSHLHEDDHRGHIPARLMAPISKPARWAPAKGKRYIYLTWDDAPQGPGTYNCLRAFSENGVKASFFAVGLNVHDSMGRSLIDSIQRGYPQTLLVNHGWSHAFRNHYKAYYALPDSAVEDILYNEDQFHFSSRIVRLPSSNSWVTAGENKGPASAEMVRQKLAGLGYAVIGWDLEWRLKGQRSQGATEMAEDVTRAFEEGRTNAPDAVVLLLHDRYFKTAGAVDSLNKFIRLLKEDPRNVFETIDHY